MPSTNTVLPLPPPSLLQSSPLQSCRRPRPRPRNHRIIVATVAIVVAAVALILVIPIIVIAWLPLSSPCFRHCGHIELWGNNREGIPCQHVNGSGGMSKQSGHTVCGK
jgi:hypothetical protein